MNELLDHIRGFHPSLVVSTIISLVGLVVAFLVERYKRLLIRNEKKEKIAQLFSYMPELIEGSDLSKEDLRKINELILELSLHLPRSLVCDLTEHLCDPSKRSKYKNCFCRVRAHIQFPIRSQIGWCHDLRKNIDGLIGDNISHVSNQSDTMG